MRIRFAAVAACVSLVAANPLVAQSEAVAVPALAPDTSWVARSAIYEVFVRDFSPSGNFRGVMAGLDRIQAAGANVLWLMPIYPVGVEKRKDPLGSPYSVRDYRAINPAFGTAADLQALVRAAHTRKMKVILDWVPNHTAWDHAWIREHPEYYVHDDRGEISVPRDEQGRLTDWTDVAQLDYRNPQLRAAMISAMRYWLEAFDIDGFRVDVAGFVPEDFWREALPVLRSAVRRPILLLAEWGDLKMHRLGFDLTYGWGSYGRLKAVWGGAPATTFLSPELEDMRDMPAGGMRLRFSTNHDETAWDNPPVTHFGGQAGARAAFVAMALLPGRPLLYNGQEVESPQRLGLFVREPVAWDQPGAVATRGFYRRVVQLALTNPALLTGDLQEVETSAPDDVIAYRRGKVAILVNARPFETRVSVTGLVVNGSRNLLTDRPHRGDTVLLPPYGAVVLEPQLTQ